MLGLMLRRIGNHPFSRQQQYIDDGQLSLPFPVSTGDWTEHAFHARFRGDVVARPQVRRFREWLVAEGAATPQWLDRKVNARRGKRR